MRARTVHFEWRNEPQHVFIDGREFNFKSKAEYRWAQYLQLLKNIKAIEEWSYEPTTFEGRMRYRKIRVYTPDFLVMEDGEDIYHEVKTALRQKDITRFKYLKADYPDVKIVLVLMSKPKGLSASSRKQVILIANAEKYVERTVFAKAIFHKFGIK